MSNDTITVRVWRKPDGSIALTGADPRIPGTGLMIGVKRGSASWANLNAMLDQPEEGGDGDS